jgi:LysM repeat protein
MTACEPANIVLIGPRTLARMGLKNMSKIGRLSVLTWPIVAGALVLASCGSDAASGATASTINLDATNYIVKDPVPTTISPLIGGEGAGAGSQTYVIQAGDYAIKVADQFGVPLADLLNFNGWATGNEFPFPGEEIKIPPGGTSQAVVIVAGDGVAVVAGVTIPDTGSNCEPGSYTIAAGDFEGRVASKFDVTVEALRAANSGTADYSVFYVGLKIVIPAKADC